MNLKYLVTILTLLGVSSLVGQATLIVDGFARFDNSLTIGDANTGSELELYDTDNDTDVLLDFNTADQRFVTGLNISSENLYGMSTDHRYSFITDDVVRMILTPEGFLGIGTPGPSDRLHVREDGVVGAPTTVMILESGVSKIPTLKFDEGSNVGMSIQYDGSGTGANNKLHVLGTSGTKLATFTNDGKMGVGEINPQHALDIDGNMSIDADSELLFYEAGVIQARLAHDGQHLLLENEGFLGNVFAIGDNDSQIEGEGDILLDAFDAIFFVTDVSTKAKLTNEGHFGINQNIPEGMFHVRAFENAGAAIRMENDQNTNHWSWRAKDDFLELHYNGVPRGLYNGSTGTYTVVSDRRLKENIKALNDGILARINELEPSYYYFKDDKNRKDKSIGFIAQDVLEVFPEVVQVPESDDGYYGIQYSTMAVLAVKALQEEQKEIEWLEEEIAKRETMKEKIALNKALAEKLQAELVDLKDNEIKE